MTCSVAASHLKSLEVAPKKETEVSINIIAIESFTERDITN